MAEEEAKVSGEESKAEEEDLEDKARAGSGRTGQDKAGKDSGQDRAKAAIMAAGTWRIEARKVREDKARKALVCPKSI